MIDTHSVTIDVHISCSNDRGGHGIDIPPGEVALVCFSVAFREDRSDLKQFCIEIKGPDAKEGKRRTPVPFTADGAKEAAAKAVESAQDAGVPHGAVTVEVQDPIEDFSITFKNPTEVDAASNYGKVSLRARWKEHPLPPGMERPVFYNPTNRKKRKKKLIVDQPDEPREWPADTPRAHQKWQDILVGPSSTSTSSEDNDFEREETSVVDPAGARSLRSPFGSGSVLVRVGAGEEAKSANYIRVHFPYVWESPRAQAAEIGRSLRRAGVNCRIDENSVLLLSYGRQHRAVSLSVVSLPSETHDAGAPAFPWHWSVHDVEYSESSFDGQLFGRAPVSRYDEWRPFDIGPQVNPVRPQPEGERTPGEHIG